MENAVKTQNKYQVSIDLLNDAVGKEIATSLQYMYFHTHFEDDRYQYLSKIMREISIAEMRHIEEFSDRILFLQGDVDMNASFRTRQVTDVKDMLRLALQLEQIPTTRLRALLPSTRTPSRTRCFRTSSPRRSSTSTPSVPNCKTYSTTARSTSRCNPPREASMPPRASDTPATENSSVLPDRYRGCLPGRIPFFNRICVSALCGTGSPRFGGDFPCLRAADPPMRPLRRR